MSDWYLFFIAKSTLNQNHENKVNNNQLTKLLIDKQILFVSTLGYV